MTQDALLHEKTLFVTPTTDSDHITFPLFTQNISSYNSQYKEASGLQPLTNVESPWLLWKDSFFRSLIPGRLTTFQWMAPFPYVYEQNKLDPVSSRESGHEMRRGTWGGTWKMEEE